MYKEYFDVREMFFLGIQGEGELSGKKRKNQIHKTK